MPPGPTLVCCFFLSYDPRLAQTRSNHRTHASYLLDSQSRMPLLPLFLLKIFSPRLFFSEISAPFSSPALLLSFGYCLPTHFPLIGTLTPQDLSTYCPSRGVRRVFLRQLKGRISDKSYPPDSRKGRMSFVGPQTSSIMPPSVTLVQAQGFFQRLPPYRTGWVPSAIGTRSRRGSRDNEAAQAMFSI